MNSQVPKTDEEQHQITALFILGNIFKNSFDFKSDQLRIGLGTTNEKGLTNTQKHLEISAIGCLVKISNLTHKLIEILL